MGVMVLALPLHNLANVEPTSSTLLCSILHKHNSELGSVARDKGS